MPVHHDGHGWLRVLTLHVGHTALLAYAWRQGTLGHITPVVITPVLTTPVLTTPVLLHPERQRAAQECIPVVVPLIAWPLLPLPFL